MKFDLDEKGLLTVLKPHQAALMRIVWSEGDVDSRTAYHRLQKTPYAMSRATVINFLNEMVDEGFLDYRETTGKGGHKRFYMPKEDLSDEEAFKKTLARRILSKLRSELGVG